MNTCSIPKIYYQIVYARHSVDPAHLIDNSSIYVLPANTTSRYSKKPARSDWNGEGFIAVVVAGLLQESGAAISSTGRCAGTCAVCTRALRPCSTFLVLLRMMQDRSAAAAGGGFWATKIPPSCLPGGILCLVADRQPPRPTLACCAGLASDSALPPPGCSFKFINALIALQPPHGSSAAIADCAAHKRRTYLDQQRSNANRHPGPVESTS